MELLFFTLVNYASAAQLNNTVNYFHSQLAMQRDAMQMEMSGHFFGMEKHNPKKKY